MTSVGHRIGGGESPACQDIHWRVWGRLSASPARRSGLEPGEILLHGPAGVGKTLLLRRLYWELFDNQDAEVPLLTTIPPTGFHPVRWIQRFATEAVQQWLAFTRGDAALAETGVLSAERLVDLCHASRMAPLAEMLNSLTAPVPPTGPVDATALIEQTFAALDYAAEGLQRRVVLLIDGAEHATWQEEDETLHLARVLPPVGDINRRSLTGVRRIWSSRLAPSERHPLLPPLPAATALLPVEPLGGKAAADFFDELARAFGLDYDPEELARLLPLWGGIPRWIANFVRSASETPDRSLLNAEVFLSAYVEDLLEGPTSRDLRSEIETATRETVEPTRIARVAETALAWHGVHDDARLSPTPSSPLQANDQAALSCLAAAGLARWDSGRWCAPTVPILADALRLYVSRHLHGESLERERVVLVRKHLVDAPWRGSESDLEHRIADVVLLMKTFRCQNVPGELLAAHKPGDAIPSSQAAGLAREAAPVRLPHCIGAFEQSLSTARGTTDRAEAVVAWCFAEEGYFRSDETLWVAHVCDVSVVTTEEIESLERANERIARELNVRRVQGWVLTGGRFSVEAAARMREMGLYASTWDDFQSLGEILLRRAPDARHDGGDSGGAPSQASGLHARTTPSETPANETNNSTPFSSEPEGEAPDAPPLGDLGSHSAVPVEQAAPLDETEEPAVQQKARIISTASDAPDTRTMELRLPPLDGMELVAAETAEELATDAGFPRELVEQIRMATLEGCLNAIERSANEEKEVRVEVTASAEGLTVIIENEGPMFDPQSVDSPTVDGKKRDPYKRGWGLKLIQKFMDRVVFEPIDNGTRLRMEKRNPRQTPSVDEAVSGS